MPRCPSSGGQKTGKWRQGRVLPYPGGKTLKNGRCFRSAVRMFFTRKSGVALRTNRREVRRSSRGYCLKMHEKTSVPENFRSTGFSDLSCRWEKQRIKEKRACKKEFSKHGIWPKTYRATGQKHAKIRIFAGSVPGFIRIRAYFPIVFKRREDNFVLEHLSSKSFS